MASYYYDQIVNMDAETRQIVLAVLPKVPLIARTAVLNILSLSTPSQYLTLRSEVIVAVLRSMLQPSLPSPISSVQRFSLTDTGIKGRLWVAHTSSGPAPAPSPDAETLSSTVRLAIESLIEPGAPQLAEPHFTMPDVGAVEAEWTGFRSGASHRCALPKTSEQEKYESLMAETTSPTTVLYFHGGAYYLLDPATHRPTTARLAKITGGRVYSVRYRLAPQNPFPAALLDALVSYLTLLYPPPDSLHEPVSPAHIVFSGDSAGGNLSMALLQLLLQLQHLREDDTEIEGIQWHGKEVREIPLPAGVAVNSPWLDISQSLPSWEDPSIHMFDYLPPPSHTSAKDPPACGAWPSSPPRANMYSADALLAHPLVSLATARSWRGAPPVWMCTGWEILAAEDRWMARKLAADGVRVQLEEYEGMPHCFAMVLGGIREGRRCFEGWAGFISKVTSPGGDALVAGGEGGETEITADRQLLGDMKGIIAGEEEGANADLGNGNGGGGVQTSFITIKAKSLKEVDIPLEELTPFGEDEMREMVWKRVSSLVPHMEMGLGKGSKL